MKKETKRYLRDTRLAFPVFRKDEKRFYSDFKDTISEYESQYPECSREDLINAYGTPKEVVTDYFCNMDPANYMALMKKSHYLRIVTAAALILLLSFFIIETGLSLQAQKEFRENMIKTEEVTIYYK